MSLPRKEGWSGGAPPIGLIRLGDFTKRILIVRPLKNDGMRQIIKLVPCDVAARPLLLTPNKDAMIGLLDAGFFLVNSEKGFETDGGFLTRDMFPTN